MKLIVLPAVADLEEGPGGPALLVPQLVTRSAYVYIFWATCNVFEKHNHRNYIIIVYLWLQLMTDSL